MLFCFCLCLFCKVLFFCLCIQYSLYTFAQFLYTNFFPLFTCNLYIFRRSRLKFVYESQSCHYCCHFLPGFFIFQPHFSSYPIILLSIGQFITRTTFHWFDIIGWFWTVCFSPPVSVHHLVFFRIDFTHIRMFAADIFYRVSPKTPSVMDTLVEASSL